MKKLLAIVLIAACGISCAYATRHILTEAADPLATEGGVRIDYDPPITTFGITTEAGIHLITENRSRLILEVAP